MQRNDVPFARARTLPELDKDPQIAHNALFRELEHPSPAGSATRARRHSSAAPRSRRAVPRRRSVSTRRKSWARSVSRIGSTIGSRVAS
jgi:crotonobetainyl-CoA:carnitine CoA-transferase CaiB-like acyl-CoA transferase